jgi:hypothetical protein
MSIAQTNIFFVKTTGCEVAGPGAVLVLDIQAARLEAPTAIAHIKAPWETP